MRALELFEKAWTGQQGFVTLSTLDRDTDRWRDHSFEYPAQRGKVVEFLNYAKGEPNLDVYWSPMVYRVPGRDRDKANDSRVLWADMDKVDPESLPASLVPTVTWRTSQGNYQGLWLLPRSVDATRHDTINQALTYRIGADKGGWGLTKVLRVPGTVNHKPEYDQDPPIVRVVSQNGHKLSSKTVLDLEQNQPKQSLEPTPGSEPFVDPKDIFKKHRVPARAKQLLNARPGNATRGTRSEVLWELTCLLAEAGLEVNEIVTLTRHSVWNKYDGRQDELRRLQSEARKAISQVSQNGKRPDSTRVATASGRAGVSLQRGRKDVQLSEEDELRGPQSWSEFDREHQPISWLIADIWAEREVGFISGLPKSYKSWIALDLAISVASGTRFLGSFATRSSNVLLIQEEDPRAVLQDRMAKIASQKGLIEATTGATYLDFQYELPDSLSVISNQGFSITDDDWLFDLEGWIIDQEVGLVVMDPLMMIADGFDEFKAFEVMSKVLKPLKRLRARTQAAICLVHHHTKGNSEGVGGAKSMYGSVALWAWEESALHINVTGLGKVMVERFSKHSQLIPLHIDIGDTAEGWAPQIHEGVSVEDLIELLKSTGDGMTMDELEAYTKQSRDTLGRLLRKYAEDGLVHRGASTQRTGQRGRPPIVWKPGKGEEEVESGP